MGIFSESRSYMSNGFADQDQAMGEELSIDEAAALHEYLYNQMLTEDLSELSESEQRAFLESEDYQLLCEAKKFKKKTIVALNKNDDLSRRTAQAAIVIAGEKGDPLFDKLAENRKKEKLLLKTIKNKYKTQAVKAAKEAQRDYVKDANKAKMMTVKDISNRKINE